MSGWPDPARPGVPLNPERDGWHWIESLTTGTPMAAEWIAARNGWNLYRSTHEHHAPGAMFSWRYLGPCLTPAEVAAREAAAFRRGAEAMREKEATEIDCRAIEIGRLHARYAASGFPVGGPSIAPEVAQIVASILEREALNVHALPVPEDRNDQG